MKERGSQHEQLLTFDDVICYDLDFCHFPHTYLFHLSEMNLPHVSQISPQQFISFKLSQETNTLLPAPYFLGSSPAPLPDFPIESNCWWTTKLPFNQRSDPKRHSTLRCQHTNVRIRF